MADDEKVQLKVYVSRDAHRLIKVAAATKGVSMSDLVETMIERETGQKILQRP